MKTTLSIVFFFLFLQFSHAQFYNLEVPKTQKEKQEIARKQKLEQARKQQVAKPTPQKVKIVEKVKYVEKNNDQDGDGITDAIDKCPYQKGSLKNEGCPEVIAETTKPKFTIEYFTKTAPNNSFKIECVNIEGGTFSMGCTAEQQNCGNDEKPVHSVTVSSFTLSKYEVTFAQYDAFCEATGRAKPNDYGWGRGNRPVIDVSWEDAQAFCQWIGGRLPTEAEWEYAARGGNQSKGYQYAGSNTLDDVAIYGYEKSGKQTHEVGEKKPNELGLYDMSGNVWEWCKDWYSDSYYANSPSNNPQGASSGSVRVIRGGSWYNDPQFCRVAFRDYYSVTSRNYYLGIRVVF